ncbi:gamma-glutamyl-gamma-aminobutyrate hydrolase family protein [Rhizobium leguminosarum]|uniref:gamma-glutamyl-gamma-aminobutyrate hydrolase family protein n=1 Tax=Rhizobium leguminosarum TaxID=384 RepID=UPI00124A19CF|nr:gamma-glutamyl-gamma-aminobutyrate hydrolase family protein [Rhizobium leguminosarum]
MPTVGITANRIIDDNVHRDWIRRRYIDALVGYADVEVVVLPTLARGHNSDEFALARLDGLVLTGDESNVDSCVLRNGSEPADVTDFVFAQRDRYRDRLSGASIATALSLGMPILAICRGLQELNVYFDGTLYDNLRTIPSNIRHQEDLRLERDRQYDPVHRLNLWRDGVLHRLADRTEVWVNSLHGQGIDRLGNNLVIEGVADDGLIEAIRIKDSPTFQIGVQWHPEWHIATDTFSQSLFSSFGESCRSYRKRSCRGRACPALSVPRRSDTLLDTE